MATMKSNGCPKGQHMVDGICTDKPFSSIGARLGVGTVLAGAAGMVGSAIKNTIKRKKLEKAEEEKKKATEAAKEMSTQRRGGMVKKKLMKASEGVIVKMNGNQAVQKNPGSKGVRSGVNSKAKATAKATGRTGGTSKAPKTATPKAMYGTAMKPGMMRKGGAKKK